MRTMLQRRWQPFDQTTNSVSRKLMYVTCHLGEISMFMQMSDGTFSLIARIATWGKTSLPEVEGRRDWVCMMRIFVQLVRKQRIYTTNRDKIFKP